MLERPISMHENREIKSGKNPTGVGTLGNGVGMPLTGDGTLLTGVGTT